MNKKEVQVYDYADVQVAMSARMYKKRLSGYAALGYTVVDNPDDKHNASPLRGRKHGALLVCT